MPPPYRILLLDTKSRNPNHYICLAVRDAFVAAGIEVVYVQYDDAIRKATEFRCNVFFAFDGEEMQFDVCRQLVSLCDVSILWLTDDPYEAPRNLEAAEMFDLVYTNDRASVGRYGKKGRALPFAGSEKYHYHPVLDANSDQFRYDVFFIGAAWPNRISLLNSLLRKLPGRKFKIGLSPVAGQPKTFGLPESSYLWRSSVTEFARLANRSRITLALHRDFTTSPGGLALASTPPPRLFEAALAGTLQLYDSVITETVDYLDPGQEIISYTSATDCAEKIEYYLSHPAERHAIAAAAQRKVLDAHTYKNRVQTILDDLNQLVAKPKPAPPARPKRPRLLFVTHNIRPAGHFGGVELYQEGLANNLAAQYDVFFYYQDRRKGANTYILTDAKYEALEELRFNNECRPAVLSVAVKEAAFATLLGNYKIDLIHFHHLVDHPASLVLIAKLLNIPVVLTLHDFWAMCDSHNLVDFRRRYCDIPNQPDTACDICVDSRLRKPPGTQALRRAFFRRVLDSADVVLANTAGFHRILGRFYPEIAMSKKARVLPVPLPATGFTQIVKAPRALDSKTPLRVAILGNFTFEKGGESIVFALNRLRHEPVHFTVLGRIDPPYDKILPSMDFENVRLHGSYNAAELPKLLQDMDVSIHLSIWPETYCIALSEAWHNGLVPIVSDIGALGERVIDGENGWKVPPDNPAALLDLLYRFLDNPDMLAGPKTQLANAGGLFETESDHIAELKTIYSELLSQGRTASQSDIHAIYRSNLTLFETGVVLNPDTWTHIFEAYREATLIKTWNVLPGNPYVSPADRIFEVTPPPTPAPQARATVNTPSDSGNGDHLTQIQMQHMSRRFDEIESKLDAMYESKIWHTLRYGAAWVLKLQDVLRPFTRR